MKFHITLVEKRTYHEDGKIDETRNMNIDLDVDDEETARDALFALRDPDFIRLINHKDCCQCDTAHDSHEVDTELTTEILDEFRYITNKVNVFIGAIRTALNTTWRTNTKKFIFNSYCNLNKFLQMLKDMAIGGDWAIGMTPNKLSIAKSVAEFNVDNDMGWVEDDVFNIINIIINHANIMLATNSVECDGRNTTSV